MSMSKKAQKICADHIEYGCRTECPLSEPCVMKYDDTAKQFYTRMNLAAESLDEDLPALLRKQTS